METSYFSIYIIMIAVLGFVSAQEDANLGTFAVQFKIFLAKEDPGEIVVAATATPSPTNEATTKSPVASSSSVTSSASAAVQLSSVNIQPLANSNISIHLHLKLADAFSSTTGYMATTKPQEISDTSSTVNYQYDVVYNKTVLNNEELLHAGSDFIIQLQHVATVIAWWNTNFTDWFVVDVTETQNAMATAINALNTDLANDLWRCAGAMCNGSHSGCMGNGNAVVCYDKCIEFEKTNNCTDDPSVDGVYLSGTCKIDANGNAYCDCGMSPGDVMYNFFDGHQCVSVTFIVAMAASAGGFFFLLLLIALCCLCGRKDSKKHGSPRDSLRNVHTTYNGYSEGHGHTGVEMNHRAPSNDYGSPKNRRRSSLTNNNYTYDVTVKDTVEFKSIRL